MTDAIKRINPLNFVSNLADIHIRIWINPEIQKKSRFEIPDHFWLRFWPWWRFALSEDSLVIYIFNTLVSFVTFANVSWLLITAEAGAVHLTASDQLAALHQQHAQCDGVPGCCVRAGTRLSGRLYGKNNHTYQ